MLATSPPLEPAVDGHHIEAQRALDHEKALEPVDEGDAEVLRLRAIDADCLVGLELAVDERTDLTAADRELFAHPGDLRVWVVNVDGRLVDAGHDSRTRLRGTGDVGGAQEACEQSRDAMEEQTQKFGLSVLEHNCRLKILA